MITGGHLYRGRPFFLQEQLEFGGFSGQASGVSEEKEWVQVRGRGALPPFG